MINSTSHKFFNIICLHLLYSRHNISLQLIILLSKNIKKLKQHFSFCVRMLILFKALIVIIINGLNIPRLYLRILYIKTLFIPLKRTLSLSCKLSSCLFASKIFCNRVLLNNGSLFVAFRIYLTTCSFP